MRVGPRNIALFILPFPFFSLSKPPGQGSFSLSSITLTPSKLLETTNNLTPSLLFLNGLTGDYLLQQTPTLIHINQAAKHQIQTVRAINFVVFTKLGGA
ncbi:hypothetical protein S83_050506 [Arachis hypogaea]